MQSFGWLIQLLYILLQIFKAGFVFFILIGVFAWPCIWCYPDGDCLNCVTEKAQHGTPQTSTPPFNVSHNTVEVVANQQATGRLCEAACQQCCYMLL